MAVARAWQLEPLKTSTVPVNHAALIIGGGAAGMTAALTLADQGFPAHIVEREASSVEICASCVISSPPTAMSM